VNSPGVTVIVCCYNSASRLRETLSHLAAQVVTCPVEIVLVDNACTDNTVSVARELWTEKNRVDIPLKVVAEPQPGLAHARERGIEAAGYETLILCDDDNWLDREYVQRAFDLMGTYAETGIAGGLIDVKYEIEPPAWFHNYAHLLAVGRQATCTGDITLDPGFVFGAGMVIRKSAYMEIQSLGFRPILSDRKKKQLTSGGDTEVCFAARLAGWRIFYDERMKLTHYMPRERISWDYIKRLQFAMGRSSIYFVAYYEHLMPDNFRMPRGWKKSWWFQFLATLKAVITNGPAAFWQSLRGVRGGQSQMSWYFQSGRALQTLSLGTSLQAKYAQVDNFVSSARRFHSRRTPTGLPKQQA
jgi:glycosyltransferase involved in cell wall biosynthesis